MFIFAPTLSKISPIVDHTAGITAIRSLCFSLLIIPILSALRGYFQGLNYSFPFGVSQLLEQLVRVVCILVRNYLIRVQFNGSILSAVILSTFASSIGNSCISLSTFIGKKICFNLKILLLTFKIYISHERSCYRYNQGIIAVCICRIGYFYFTIN